MKKILIFIIVIYNFPFFAENYYDRYFQKLVKTEYNDTMFERIIWHKKVSHLIIESLNNGFYVTLLVIPETPYNYKAKTYPLHYYFKSYPEAFKKFTGLNGFLRNKGILKVKINGSIITEENILSDGTIKN